MRKVLVSGMIGNALEWYDYALYAQFASIIGMHFFPNSELREILTYAVFASGFIIRPLGAIVFGNIGDRLGRRLALALGILTMAIPTAAIGFLPSYQTIGVAAPILLTVIRLIQGFSLGGEFSGCIAYIVESSPKKSRGLAGSAAFVSMCAGMLFGTFTASFCKFVMSETFLIEFGWRIPFVAGLFIGLVGLYIRWNLKESPAYVVAKEKGYLSRSPVKDLFKDNLKELFVSMGLYLTVTVPFYIITVYMDSYFVELGFSSKFASQANILMLTTMIFFLPISAFISDTIGRKPVMIIGCLLFIALSYPIFWTMNNADSDIVVLLSACTLAAISGFFMGPVPTVLVENFPTKVRFTGVALSYNMSAAVFGGTAPMVCIMLIKYFGDKLIIAYYISFFALITLFVLKYYNETNKISLNEDE